MYFSTIAAKPLGEFPAQNYKMDDGQTDRRKERFQTDRQISVYDPKTFDLQGYDHAPLTLSQTITGFHDPEKEAS